VLEELRSRVEMLDGDEVYLHPYLVHLVEAALRHVRLGDWEGAADCYREYQALYESLRRASD